MKMSKACDISPRVKEIVWERDNHMCIICGSPYAMPNSHYIKRSQCGLGIPQNIATMCQRCHEEYDNGSGRYTKAIKESFRDYLMSIYPGWNEEDLKYDRWRK